MNEGAYTVPEEGKLSNNRSGLRGGGEGREGKAGRGAVLVSWWRLCVASTSLSAERMTRGNGDCAMATMEGDGAMEMVQWRWCERDGVSNDDGAMTMVR